MPTEIIVAILGIVAALIGVVAAIISRVTRHEVRVHALNEQHRKVLANALLADGGAVQQGCFVETLTL